MLLTLFGTVSIEVSIILNYYRNDYHLTICSMDGTVKSIVFDAKELGRLLTFSEMVFLKILLS